MGGLPKGEVLILAGDICVAQYLDPKMNDAHSRGHRTRFLRFFERAANNFDRVLYIAGNHEYYGCDYAIAQDLLAQTAEKFNIQFLENGVAKINGLTFICATLWSDMNGRDPIAIEAVRQGMNDFHLIYKDGRKFHPNDAIDEFDYSVAFIDEELARLDGQPAVVVTHHVPSFKGIGQKHVGSHLNGGYASRLDEFILDHPNISHWIFGHTHIQKSFEIGGTKVLTNARGYAGIEDSARTFDPKTHFEILQTATEETAA